MGPNMDGPGRASSRLASGSYTSSSRPTGFRGSRPARSPPGARSGQPQLEGRQCRRRPRPEPAGEALGSERRGRGGRKTSAMVEMMLRRLALVLVLVEGRATQE